METSIFTDKSVIPDNSMLREALVTLYPLWIDIMNYVSEKYPGATEEWNFPGPKYGWSFRMKDKKRAIIYLLPRDGFFLVALVFGEKATTCALGSDISGSIKDIILSARVYAEGRGFRIEIRDSGLIEDVKKLIDIKLSY